MKSIYKNKRVISTIIVILLVISMIAGTTITVFADETKILTLGADLTDEQKQLIINYLGVDISDVEVITVNNEDEHHYLDGIVAEQTIGHHTYSCSYIEPTTEGGIHIKTVNLTYVDCDMIRNALITSGITNANVICVAPKEVSGTGAMVGIFKAYEHIESEDLDEEKIELGVCIVFQNDENTNRVFIYENESKQVQSFHVPFILKDDEIEEQRLEAFFKGDIIECIKLTRKGQRLAKEERGA